jgi:hypothetical protein
MNTLIILNISNAELLFGIIQKFIFMMTIPQGKSVSSANIRARVELPLG